MDYTLVSIEVITPLLIALIVLWVDRRLRYVDEFDSIIDNLIGELCQNLALVRTMTSGIEVRLSAIKNGGWSRTPDPLLSKIAFSRTVASEVFFNYMRKNNNGFVRKLMEYYSAQDIVNQEIRQINEAKFNFLINRNIPLPIFEILLEQQKKTIDQVIEPSLVNLLSVLSSMKLKYRQTIELYKV